MPNPMPFPRAFVCLALLSSAFLSLGAKAQQVTYSSVHRNSETSLPQTLSGGTATLRTQLQTSRSGISLAVADFDSDGVQDLVTGYAAGSGGALVLQRGAAVALAPTPREWAMMSAGQVVIPFATRSEVTAIAVHPDFLKTADMGGHGHSDLIVAAKGGGAIYLLMGDGKGGFSAPQILTLAGSLNSLATWRGPDGKTLAVAGICSASGCGVQFLKADGTTSSIIPTAGAVSATDVGSLNRGVVPDVAVIAGGSVVLIDGDSILSGAPRTETLPVTNGVGLASGSFVYDRRGYLQLAVLGADATLHVLTRAGIDTSLPSARDVLMNRVNERNHVKRQAAPAPAGMAWSEVETLANIGPGSNDALILRARLSGRGGDDLVVMAGRQLVQIAHPLGAGGRTTPIVTIDSTSGVVSAAVPARISADSRQGLITADGSLRPAISIPPTNNTFTVNTAVDGLSALNTAGLCTNPSVPCTIRDAVGLANLDVTTNGTSEVDTINIPAGTYTFTTAFHPANDFEDNVNYHYDLDASMNLVGAGSGSTIINGNSLDKVFSVDSGIVNPQAPFEVFLSGMTIENGVNSNNPANFSNDFGGLMDWEAFGDGYLTLSHCILNNGIVQDGPGGGIATSNSAAGAAGGVLELDNSTVSNGNTPEQGGGLFVGQDNPLILNTVVLSNNNALLSVNPADTAASGVGGGILYTGLVMATTASTITNSTFSGNATTVDGGGMNAGGAIAVSGSSFTTNTAGRYGGGLSADTLATASVITSSTFTGNTSVTDGAAIFVTADVVGNNLTMHYSRIHGNTGGTHTGIGVGAVGGDATATVDATDNWWGCNGAATGTGCDTGGATVGTVTLSPYTTLTISLSANPLSSGTSLTATGSLGQDSAATTYTTGEDTAYFGVPATLAIVQGASTTNSSATALNASASIPTTATATQSGTATVTVDGTSVSANFTVTVAAPTVTSISPNSGTFSGGTTVTITGTNFTGTTGVQFGATAATSFTVVSDTQIVAVSPAGSVGVVDVTVTTAGGTSVVSAADQFTYLAAAPTIAFSIANQTFGVAPFTVAATSNSGGAITYSLVSGNATVTSAGLVTITGIGQVTVLASQVASGNYTAGTAQAMFTVSNEAPTITFSVPNQTYGVAPFTVAASSNSGGAITYSVVSGSATVTSAGVVTITGIGSVTLKATQAAAGNYGAGTVQATFNVSAAAPTITFSVPNQTYGVAPFTVAASSNSGGAITYSLVSGNATVTSAGLVTLTGTGSVTLQASQVAAGNYTAGTVQATFTVFAQAPTITFSIPNQMFGVPPFTVVATSNSPGAITYSLVSGNATVTSVGLVTLTGTGSVTVKATQVASGSYAAGTAEATFTVTSDVPSITFSVPNQTYGVAPFTVVATSNSSGAITYSLVSGNATVTSAGVVTLTGTGSITLKATQAAAGNYTAGSAQATFTVSAEAPTITFSIPNQTFGVAPFTVAANSNSTGAITYSLVSGNATVTSAGLVTLTGTGSITIQASQAAAGNYTAGSAQAMFTVSAEAPTITFSIPNQTFGVAPFTVVATSNSTGAITYSLVSGNATVTSAGLVTLTGTGSVTVKATQAAAGNYSAGTAQAVFMVTLQGTTTTLTASSGSIAPNQTVTLTATVTPNSSGTPMGSVTFSANGNVLATVPISGGVAQLTTLLPAGESAVITAVYLGDSNFMGSSGTTSVVVAAFDFTLTGTGAAAYTVVPGVAATYNFALAPLYGSYAAPVSFSVTGLPSGATASFSPSSVGVNGGPTPVTMTVQTASVVAHNSGRGPLERGIMFALLLLPFLGRRNVRRKLKSRMLLLVTLMAGLTMTVTGCGSSNGFFLQNSQTYTLTVTATSGTLQHSQTVTLIVQ
jgi:trimeric autotransporter adhesin